MPANAGEVVHFPQPRGALHPPRRGTIDPWVWLLALALLVMLVGCEAPPDPGVMPTNCANLGGGLHRCVDASEGVACYLHNVYGGASISCVRVEPMPLPSLGRAEVSR